MNIRPFVLSTLTVAPHYACDLIGIIGAVAIAYGAGLWAPWLGFIVGGAELIGASMLFGRHLNANTKDPG